MQKYVLKYAAVVQKIKGSNSTVVQYEAAIRLAKCHHPHHPGWCKIVRTWVKFVTEHTVFCRKFNLLPQICVFLVGQRSAKYSEYYFKVFVGKLLVYFEAILIILVLF